MMEKPFHLKVEFSMKALIRQQYQSIPNKLQEGRGGYRELSPRILGTLAEGLAMLVTLAESSRYLGQSFR